MAGNNNLMTFAPEKDQSESDSKNDCYWNILIVDDEESVHETTIRVLKDIQFEGKKIHFLQAYSKKEAIQVLKDNYDISVILLDVVMEEENSGLLLVKYIREILNNTLVRIILRTGQPGKSPEKEVIIEYDINDYRAKTDLTVNQLFSAIISSLRSYQDLKIINKSKNGLEYIINATSDLFLSKSVKEFAFGALMQLLSFLKLDEHSLFINVSGLSLELEKEGKNRFLIHAATGKFEKYVDQYADSLLSEDIIQYLELAIQKKESFFDNNCYIAYSKSSTGSVHLLYFSSNSEISEIDRNLITLFSENVRIAFENVNAYIAKSQSQNEIIFMLSNILEHNSLDMDNHVKRVSEFAGLLGRKAGLNTKEIEILVTASAVHDIGNILIPKTILDKPTKLTEDEFNTVQNHALAGFNILNKFSNDVMQNSSIIALQHHERFNGSGYPNKLKGEEIDIKARIINIVDTFDVLLHQRKYKEAWGENKVIDYMEKESGRQFDPDLVSILLKNIDEFLTLNKFLSKN